MTGISMERTAREIYSECIRISSAPKEIHVSVVVPAYFSGSTIEDCLKSLASLDYPKELIEIIVIDSGDDDTKNICKRYNVLYHHNADKLSAGAARNRGIEIAKGQIIAFLDADCIAPKQWIHHIIEDLDDFPDAFGVLGVYSGGKSSLDKVRGGELMPSDKKMGFHRGFIEGNVAFKREVFDSGCRFGDMTYGECIKISKELAQRGMQTVWDPTLKVFHKGHLTYRKMFSMDRAYSRISLGLERWSLSKGIMKLLYLMIMFISIPFWPLMAGSMALLLFAIFTAYSLSDKMVSPKYRVRYLSTLIVMRLSRFFASALETLLYLIRGE